MTSRVAHSICARPRLAAGPGRCWRSQARPRKAGNVAGSRAGDMVNRAGGGTGLSRNSANGLGASQSAHRRRIVRSKLIGA